MSHVIPFSTTPPRGWFEFASKIKHHLARVAGPCHALDPMTPIAKSALSACCHAQRELTAIAHRHLSNYFQATTSYLPSLGLADFTDCANQVSFTLGGFSVALSTVCTFLSDSSPNCGPCTGVALWAETPLLMLRMSTCCGASEVTVLKVLSGRRCGNLEGGARLSKADAR